MSSIGDNLFYAIVVQACYRFLLFSVLLEE
jgi:hypothetical protein